MSASKSYRSNAGYLISVDFLGEEVASCDVSLQVVVDHPSFRMKI